MRVNCPCCKESQHIRIIQDKDHPFTGMGLFNCTKCGKSWK